MKPEELICKAQRKDNGEWIEGFYFCMQHNDERTHLHHFLIPTGADLSKGTPIDKIQVEVVPESITLKAQEPMSPVYEQLLTQEIPRCGKCGYRLVKGNDKYCCRCGQAVKWE